MVSGFIDQISGIANSAFTTSLVGSLAGAYWGATAAQKIAEREKERTELLAQIRSINTANTLAFIVCNAAIGLKKQQTQALCRTYFQKKQELEDLMRKRVPSQGLDAPFEFQADLRTLPFPEVPIESLRNIVFNKLNASTRTTALVPTIEGAIGSLRETIANRNRLIETIKRLPPETREQSLPAIYFGLPYGAGHVSTEYLDCMHGIHNLVDDVIFFSQLLCKDLTVTGDAILKTYKTKFRQSTEKIQKIDFKPAIDEGLIPPDSQYDAWLNGFKETEHEGKNA